MMPKKPGLKLSFDEWKFSKEERALFERLDKEHYSTFTKEELLHYFPASFRLRLLSATADREQIVTEHYPNVKLSLAEYMLCYGKTSAIEVLEQQIDLYQLLENRDFIGLQATILNGHNRLFIDLFHYFIQENPKRKAVMLKSGEYALLKFSLAAGNLLAFRFIISQFDKNEFLELISHADDILQALLLADKAYIQYVIDTFDKLERVPEGTVDIVDRLIMANDYKSYALASSIALSNAEQITKSILKEGKTTPWQSDDVFKLLCAAHKKDMRKVGADYYRVYKRFYKKDPALITHMTDKQKKKIVGFGHHFFKTTAHQNYIKSTINEDEANAIPTKSPK
jgi:hypothetical protein